MKRKEKVLLFHSNADLYGASKIFLYGVKCLRENGYDVTVVLSENGSLADELRFLAIKTHIQRLGIIRRKYFNIFGLFNRIFVLFQAYRFLKKLHKKEKFTLIYSNTLAVLVGAFFAKLNKVYHIYHVHEIIENPRWFSWMMGKIVNFSSQKVIVVSQAVKNNLKKTVDENKIELIYNGLDYSQFLQLNYKDHLSLAPQGKVIIGMIGRVNHWKGQGYFLKIAKQLLRSNQQVHFIIVGDAFPGNEHLVDELIHDINEMGLNTDVSYLGYRMDIPEVLHSLDIFVLPSILPDPLPTVILEAMAASKPVVATAHGGALEMVVAEKTGSIIPWDDEVEASKVLMKLVSDPGLRKKMGEEGRKRVFEKFSKESFESKYISLFEKIER